MIAVGLLYWAFIVHLVVGMYGNPDKYYYYIVDLLFN
jgi:hypothetical protein